MTRSGVGKKERKRKDDLTRKLGNCLGPREITCPSQYLNKKLKRLCDVCRVPLRHALHPHSVFKFEQEIDHEDFF